MSRAERLGNIVRPGIRTSLLLGFGAMLLIMVVTATIALIATSRISDSSRSLLSVRIPATVEVLQVARATDALVLASGQLDSIDTADELDELVDGIRASQMMLEQSLVQLQDSRFDTGEVQQQTSRLTDNLVTLTAMADERIVLQRRADEALQRMQDTNQEMNRQLVHRIRVLQSDGDVLRRLLMRPKPPLETTMRIADSLAEQVPAARFFMLVDQAHSTLQAIAEADSANQLSLQNQVLARTHVLAERSFATLPEDVRAATLSPFEELKEMADSRDGMPSIREEQLRVMGEIDSLIEENLRLNAAVEASTGALMQSGMQGIQQAAADADRQRSIYTTILVITVALGLLLVGPLVVFYVNRHLIHRLAVLSRAMRDISQGRFDTRLPPAGKDELGQLGAAVHVFHQAAIEADSRGQALEKANKRLQGLARQDATTGIANRRYFDETIEAEYARARRMQHPLSLIFLDIDHFKDFNDQYGHQSGDACLARVGEALRTMFRRAGELPARYGGEEFCVILPGVEARDAAACAEAVRTGVMALRIPHAASEEGVVTVSVGVACIHEPGARFPDELLRMADQAMYEAKRSGRNTVVTAEA